MHYKTHQFVAEHDRLQPKYPPLPAGTVHEQFEWIVCQSGAPWLELANISVPYSAMLIEAKNLRSQFVEHREHESHTGWYSLAIHGLSAQKTQHADVYGLDTDNAVYNWTEIQSQCPVTVNFFRDVFPFDQYQRIRFMLLTPGGCIAPHSDYASENIAVNISLNHPAGCKLTTVYGTVPFQDSGSMFLFNNHYEHAVVNSSSQDRYHVIAHGKPSLKFKLWAVHHYKKSITT